MTYQIGWKGLLMLRFLTAKKKAGLFTRWKTKLSTEKLRKRYLAPSDPALSLPSSTAESLPLLWLCFTSSNKMLVVVAVFYTAT